MRSNTTDAICLYQTSGSEIAESVHKASPIVFKLQIECMANPHPVGFPYHKLYEEAHGR
jgi:hypothetical protein